jgi:23S rRNA (uracil1939-C5)-methyltransferase
MGRPGPRHAPLHTPHVALDTRQLPLPCPHFPNCAGCAYIGRPYGEQLRLKHERVRAAFSQFASLAALPIPEVIGSPRAFGYRNQAKLVARRARRGLLLGVYRPGSHQVVDIRRCPAHDPLINRVVEEVARQVERHHISIYDERAHTGVLRYVVVRVSQWSKAAQIILVTNGRDLPQAHDLVQALKAVRGVTSIVQNVNADPGNVIFGTRFVPLTRETALIERIGPFKLKTHAGAFLQANVAAARKVYDLALRWAAPTERETCVDLYCGAGALTFYLATAAAHVVGIEESPVAVADAKENIRLNGFHQVRFHCGAAAQTLSEVVQRLGRIDVITLNPPRKGTDPATRAAITAARPTRIVYVSCDAATLARDLDWFAAHGYIPVRAQPFDLLPQTEHVECVALLESAAVA